MASVEVNTGSACFDCATGTVAGSCCNDSWLVPGNPGVTGGETKDDCMGDALRELPGRLTVMVLGIAEMSGESGRSDLTGSSGDIVPVGADAGAEISVGVEIESVNLRSAAFSRAAFSSGLGTFNLILSLRTPAARVSTSSC